MTRQALFDDLPVQLQTSIGDTSVLVLELEVGVDDHGIYFPLIPLQKIEDGVLPVELVVGQKFYGKGGNSGCLLYTSDAADE